MVPDWERINDPEEVRYQEAATAAARAIRASELLALGLSNAILMHDKMEVTPEELLDNVAKIVLKEEEHVTDLMQQMLNGRNLESLSQREAIQMVERARMEIDRNELYKQLIEGED